MRGGHALHSRWVVVSIACSYVILATIYSFTVPILHDLDEPRHYAYVRYLVNAHQLPIIGMEHITGGAHAQHPPLYYLLLTPIYVLAHRFGDATTVHVMRFFSIALGLLALLLAYRSVYMLFPTHLQVALWTTAAIAFCPHFLLDTCVVNNDVMAIATTAIYLHLLIRCVCYGASYTDAIAIGVVMSAMLMSKGTLLMLLILYPVALYARNGISTLISQGYWRKLAIGYGTVVLFTSWWYVRNYGLYGTFQPMPPGGDPSMYPFPTWFLIWRACVGLFETIWVQMGWLGLAPGQIEVPNATAMAFYTMMALITLIALIGNIRMLRSWWRRRSSNNMRKRLWGVAILYLAFGIMLVAIFYVAVFIHIGWYQGGRYLMPVLTGFMLFLVLGLWHAFESRMQHWHPSILIIALLAMNALSIWTLKTFLIPTFGPK